MFTNKHYIMQKQKQNKNKKKNKTKQKTLHNAI